MLYYMDLTLVDSGHTGSELNPWSYADYLAAREEILVTGDTVKIKGIGTKTERPQVDEFSKWIIWDKWGTEPWRLALTIPEEGSYGSTIGIIMKNGILYNLGDVGGDFHIGVNEAVPESVAGQEMVNMFIMHKPSTADNLAIHKDRAINFKGCFFGSTYAIDLCVPAPSYYDCIFAGNLINGDSNFVTYNCAFTGEEPEFGVHTLPQWEMLMGTVPLYDAPKEFFDKSVLFPNISTPPEPGYGAPDYVGYDTDPWGNKRTGIGCAFYKPNEPKESTMSKLDNIVKVVITRQTQPVGRDSFDLILVLGENYTFTERYKLYSTDNLAELAADLAGGTSDPEYLAAVAIASQNPRPNKFAGGRVDDGDSDWGDALDNIVVENSKFYGVIAATRTVADQEDVCDWVNANKRAGFFASAGTDVGAGVIDIIDQTVGADATSIAHHIKSNALDRCVAVFHAEAADDYVDAGLLAALLVQRPGTYTPMFTTVIGSSVDNLTATQQANAFDKKCSTYEEVGEVNIIQEGWVGTGEFIDLIIWVDWLKSQIQTNVYSLLVNEPKVPYTNEGIASVESRVKQVLKIEQDNGAISPDSFDENKLRTGGWITSVPEVSTVLQADKLARVLKDVKFTAFYANPIHHIEIAGIIKI